MKKIHEVKVTTMKNQEWWKKQDVKKGTYLFCQYLSNLQVYNSSNEYYNELANNGQRGSLPSNNDAGIFDIAVNLNKESVEQNLKDGFLCILREKILHDLIVYQQMIIDMKHKGAITDSNKATISMQDIVEKIVEL